MQLSYSSALPHLSCFLGKKHFKHPVIGQAEQCSVAVALSPFPLVTPSPELLPLSLP